jgi:hypothetical protein
MKALSILLFCTLLCFTACSRKAIPTTGRMGDYNSYNEDLSVARPAYTLGGPKSIPTGRPSTASVTPQAPTSETRKITTVGSAEAMHINRKVDEQLVVIGEKNRSIRYAPGFRIQLYVGNERIQAENARMQINQNFPELAPYLSYDQPTYKLKVGDFMRRIDAERYFSQVKPLIGSAMLVADKVDVRRSLLIK